jgi:tripartite-type tricarboxylate transporter receptor subunit TctC
VGSSTHLAAEYFAQVAGVKMLHVPYKGSPEAIQDAMPEVPPLAEQGLKDFDISLWFGVWAPAGTPPAIVNKINAQIAVILQSPEVREQFAKLGITPSPMKPDEFGRFVREQIETYRAIVKKADIQPL